MTPFKADEAFAGLGFERISHVHGSTYKDSSTIIIAPMRGQVVDGVNVPVVHQQVVNAWRNLMAPMNQPRAFFDCVGHEVGLAYGEMIAYILADPVLSKWKYILTLEDDNLPPPDAHIRLLESIEQTGADAVSGIYFTKGDLNMPQAYGDPQAAPLDFRPIDTAAFIQRGNIVEVNGIAMGCALWRMDLFRQISAPWFVTVADVIDGQAKAFTQDLYFCERARRAGKRFFVDFRVKVDISMLEAESSISVAAVAKPLKLDLGCGQNPREGFEGVDVWSGAAHVVDLFKFPWSFADSSVDELHSSHFIEHLPMTTVSEDDLLEYPRKADVDQETHSLRLRAYEGKDLFFAFFDECFRILKPGARMTVIWPALQSVRAFQDPTHRRFIPAETMLYLSKEWRTINKLDHYKVDCNFGISVNPTTLTTEGLRHPQVQGERLRERWNVAIDFHASLTALK